MRNPRERNAAKHLFFSADRQCATAYLRAIGRALTLVEASVRDDVAASDSVQALSKRRKQRSGNDVR